MSHIDLSPFEGRELTDADMQHLVLHILFQPRDKSPSYAESIFAKAEKHSGLCAERMDPMLELMGFEQENIPRLDHLFVSEMGNFFETFIKCIFRLSFPELYTEDYMEKFGKLTDSQIAEFKKQTGDFIWGLAIIELKYRYGSSEGLTKQKEVAKLAKQLGANPVILCFRSSPNAKELRETSDFSVFEGEEVIEYTHRCTGIDIRRCLKIAAKCPLIQKRLRDLQSLYDQKTRAKLDADHAYALAGHRQLINHRIKTDDGVRSEFLQDNGIHDKVLQGFMDEVLLNGNDILDRPHVRELLEAVTNNKNITDCYKTPKKEVQTC